MLGTFCLVSILFCLGLCDDTYTWGYDVPDHPKLQHAGTRYQNSNIDAENVDKLRQEWVTQLCGPVLSTPSIVDGKVYVGDHAGCLTSLDEKTGTIIWQKNLELNYGLANKSFSRNTPTYYKGYLVIQQSGRWGFLERSDGVSLLLVRASDGSLVWKREISTFYRSLLTGSCNVEKDVIYLGLSSNEEAAGIGEAVYLNYTFGGRMMAFHLNGTKLWDTPTSPPELIGPGKYAGGAIVAHPVIYDDYVLVSTANMYWVPQSVTDCLRLNGTNSSCVDERINFNSVIKFNKKTGQIVGKPFHADPYDAWNAACLIAGLRAACPEFKGADGAFIDSPMVFHHRGKSFIGIGQKTGIFWILDFETLKVVAKINVGPGSASGGVMYASTINKKNEIFVASTNGGFENRTTIDGEVITYGAFLKINPGTWDIEWEKPTPDHTGANAALSTTNDLVFVRTTGGRLMALQSDCGKIKWSFQTGITGSIAGVAMNKKSIYFGTGPVLMFTQGAVATPHPFYCFKLA